MSSNFNIGITWNVGNTASVVSGINQVNGSLTKLQSGATQASTNIGSFGTSMSGTLPALKSYHTDGQRAVGTNSAMSTSFGTVKNALGGMSSQVSTTSKALPAMTSAQEAAANSSNNLAAKTQNTTAKLTQIGSKVGGLSFLFGGLIAAMGESAGMQEQLQAQQEKLNEAQKNAAEVIKQYGAGSSQAAEALKGVEKAEKSVAFAGRIARLSYQDQIFYILALSSLAIGPAVTAFGKFREAQIAAAQAGVPLIQALRTQGGAVGKLFGLFDRLRGSTGTATAALNTMPPALKNVGITTVAARSATTGLTGALGFAGGQIAATTKATTGFRGAMNSLGGSLKSSMGLLGPIGVALLAAGAAMAIIGTNTFGSRTALDAFGKSTGDQIPLLGVLFEGLRDVGEAMGLAEDNGRSATDAWHAMEEQHRKNAESAISHSEAWGILFQSIVDHPITQAIIGGLQTIGTELTRVFMNVNTQIGNALLGVGAAIMTHVVKPILNIPSQIVNLGQAIINTIVQGWNQFTNLIHTNIIQPILDIPNQVRNLGQAIVNTIVQGWNAFTGFVNTHIIQPILGIPGNIGNIGQSIVNTIIQGWTGIVGFVKTHIVTPLLNIPTLIPALGKKIVDTIVLGWNTFVSMIKTNIVDPILNVPSFLSSLGQDILNSIISGWNTFTNLIKTNLVDPILDIPTHLSNLGQLILDTLSKGWDSFVSIVQENIVKPILDVPKHLSNLPGMIMDSFGNIAADVTSWIEDNIGKPFADFNQKLDDNFKKGQSVFDAFVNAFTTGADEVIAKSNEAVTKGVDPMIARTEALEITARSMRERLGTMWDDYVAKVPAALIQTETAEQRFKDLTVNGIKLTTDELKIMQLVLEAYQTTQGTVNQKIAAAEEVITNLGTAEDATAKETEKVTNAMISLGDSIAAGAKDLAAYSTAMANGTFQTQTFLEGQQQAELELVKVAQELQNTGGQVEFYSQKNALAVRMVLEFALGAEQARLALVEENAELANGVGQLSVHIEQLKEGTLQQLSFKQGVLEAAQALVEQIRALEHAKGVYEANNILMKDGTLQAVEFAAGIQETKTAVQENALEVANLAGQLEGYNTAATKSEEANNALIRGFIEQKQALTDLLFEYAETVGAVEALRIELANSENATLRFNKGLAEGKKSALEFAVGMQETRGEAIGFRSELLDAAQKISGAMTDMSRKSTEELQQIIEVANGVPGAFEKVVQGIDAMGQKIVDKLAKAGEEGKNAFNDNIEKLEEELRAKFSEPLTRELEIQTNIQKVQTEVEGLMGVLATTLRDKPLEVALQTQAAQDAMSLLIQRVDQAAAMSPKFQPLQTALHNLAAWTPGQGLDRLPVLLTDVLQGAQGLEGGMQGAIQQFDSMFSSVAQTQQGLAALDAAFSSIGLTFDETTGKITDSTGKMIGQISGIGPAATTAATEVDTGLLQMSTSGDAARDAWARDMQIMFLAVDQFGKHAQTMAGTVSGAFSNMSANVNASLNTLASDFIIILNAFTGISSASQQMASTVSGSFSNMATNTRASMNTMASGIQILLAAFTRMGSDAQRMSTTVSSAFTTMGSRITSATNTARSAITSLQSAVNTLISSGSRVSSFGSTFSSAMSRVQSSASSARSAVASLASAINSLRSRSITITVTTVYRTVFAAKGGAFVANSPMKIGPMHVSEFGQKELVTVTPLENPSGQTITGPGMQVSTSGKGAKAFARSGNQSISLGGGNDNNINSKDVRAFVEEIFRAIENKTQTSRRKQQNVVRELPIIIKIGERTLIDIINRRIFEMSDPLL